MLYWQIVKNSGEVLEYPFFKWAEPPVTSFDIDCLPYTNGVTEPLQRLLHNNGI